jgi:cobalamin biosynthesis protein CobD/CbiB
MKLYTALTILVSFLAGIALDMSLSHFIMDIIFIAGIVCSAIVLTLIARRPRKKGMPRRQSRVVKSRKVAKVVRRQTHGRRKNQISRA